jgi:hypothetical protein
MDITPGYYPRRAILQPRRKPRFLQYGSIVHFTRHSPLQCMRDERGSRFEVIMEMFVIIRLVCNGLGARKE